MITEKDLRIGNYVQDKNGFIFKVVSIHDDGTIYCDFEGNEGDVWEFDKNNPPCGVELTEEILLKCGFEKVQGFIVGVGLFVGLFYSHKHKKLKYSLSQSLRLSILDIYIKHLHQLQNLHHALEGKELEINLK